VASSSEKKLNITVIILCSARIFGFQIKTYHFKNYFLLFVSTGTTRIEDA